jgi:tRNA threonylcarbamoyladenosine biosynthesis protein TsaB
MAVVGGARGKVLAVLDAGRGEVYVGEYEVTDDAARRLSERILPKAEFLAEARGSGQIVTGDPGLSAAAAQAGLTVSTIQPVGAEAVARLGWRKIVTGETVSPEQLEANYIRRSDAEIFGKGSF